MKYSFQCIHCGKNKQSILKDKKICNKCAQWTAPGKNQMSLISQPINLKSKYTTLCYISKYPFLH